MIRAKGFTIKPGRILPDKKWKMAKKFMLLVCYIVDDFDRDLFNPRYCGTLGQIIAGLVEAFSEGDYDELDLSNWSEKEKYILVTMTATTIAMHFWSDDDPEKIEEKTGAAADILDDNDDDCEAVVEDDDDEKDRKTDVKQVFKRLFGDD